MNILPVEAVSYKQQIKENELLTKLRVIKLVEKSNHTQVEVAKKFNCHRNTVGGLIRDFKNYFSEDLQNKLLNDTWDLDRLLKLLKPLKNRSRRPQYHPAQANEAQEGAIAGWLFNDEELKVGPYQMKTLIERRFSDSEDEFLQSLVNLSEAQIKGIYKRYSLKCKKKRSCSGAKVHLYDYKSLACFECFHFDTKHILDKKSLPKQIYEQFSQTDWMPRYQWTLQDAKSRFRFLAYSRHINAEYGLKFLIFCLMYIRSTFNNWHLPIAVGFDQGSENCCGSKEKLKWFNKVLKPLKTSAYQYHVGNDIRKNLVERSHLTDDRYFYIPRANNFTSKKIFIEEAAGFYHYFNFLRPHTGIEMHKRTPFEVIEESGYINPKRLMKFPIMILDDEIEILRKATDRWFYQAELEKIGLIKVTKKDLIDVAAKYDFFTSPIAQNDLTYYLI
jgi:hypothetical protein